MGRRLVIEEELTPVIELADAIITSQQRAVGELAYALANQVRGLRVDPGTLPQVEGDDIGVIDLLVREYAAISGAIGPRLCFQAAEPVLRRHPSLRVPAFEGLESSSPANAAPEGGLKRFFRR